MSSFSFCKQIYITKIIYLPYIQIFKPTNTIGILSGNVGNKMKKALAKGLKECREMSEKTILELLLLVNF